MRKNFVDCIDIVGESCKRFEGTKKYISTGAVQNGEIDDSQVEIVDYATKPSRANVQVRAGDVLFAKMQNTVKVLSINEDLAENIYSTGFFAIRAKEELLNPRCLQHILRSESFNRAKDKECKGATQKALNNDGLAAININIPNEDQGKIADELDQIESVIKALSKKYELFDELVKARFVELFGNETNPYNWPMVSIESVADVQVGVVIKPAQYYTDQAHGTKAFRSLNIGEMFIKDEDWVYFSDEGNQKNKKSILMENDLLIVRSGAPGTSCVVTAEYAGSNAIDVIIAHPDINKVNPYYLCAYTNFPHGKYQIEKGIGGAAQQHFNVGKYNAMQLMLPPMSLQNEFYNFLRQIDKSKFEVQKKIDLYTELLNKKMDEYFNSEAN